MRKQLRRMMLLLRVRRSLLLYLLPHSSCHCQHTRRSDVATTRRKHFTPSSDRERSDLTNRITVAAVLYPACIVCDCTVAAGGNSNRVPCPLGQSFRQQLARATGRKQKQAM